VRVSTSCLLCCKRPNTAEVGAAGLTLAALARRLSVRQTYPVVFRLLHQLPLCAICLLELPWIEGPICTGCGRSWSSGECCGDCRRYADKFLEMNRSILRYDDRGRQLIRQYKYRGDERLTELLSTLLAIGYYRYLFQAGLCLITYVPLHANRLEERGFNQAERIAARFAQFVKHPVKPLLVRTKMTDKLSKQGGRSARIQSLAEAFQPVEPAACPIVPLDKAILLVDDIFTTGSTLRFCARAIRQYPPFSGRKVYSLTIFR